MLSAPPARQGARRTAPHARIRAATAAASRMQPRERPPPSPCASRECPTSPVTASRLVPQGTWRQKAATILDQIPLWKRPTRPPRTSQSPTARRPAARVP
eukprot:638714-Prymnesium_polylepis.1